MTPELPPGSRLKERAQRLRDLVVRDLWRDIPTPSRLKALGLQAARVFVLAGRNFWLDRCLMRATSLAYVTLLSLVPLLALAFSVLKGLGVGDQIKPLLIERVAAGQKEIVEHILNTVERTNVRALGTIGLLFLLWTTVKLLGTIEATFNHIWNVKRARRLLRKVADYVSVVVIAPILLVVAMSVTTAFQSTALVASLRESAIIGPVTELLLGWLPFVGTWVAFSAVYLFMPNTRVRLSAALVGGVVGGTAWQVAFWVYTHFQIGVARYGAIYTTFAALPIFMIWVYLSWAVVLFGAEMAYATQNVGRYWEERRAAGASFATLQAVGLRAMIALSTAFHRDGSPLTVEEIARRCNAPGRLVSDVLQMLVAGRICAEVVGEKGGSAFHPGRALERITPAQVLEALRRHGDSLELAADAPEAHVAQDVLGAYDAAVAGDLGHTTFRHIARRLTEGEEA